MWNIIQKSYQEADKHLGGWLPNGGTGNPLSNAARPVIQKGRELIPKNNDVAVFAHEMADRGVKSAAINKFQQANERATAALHRSEKVTPYKPKQGWDSHTSASDQIDLYGAGTSQVKMCPVNRDSYRLAKATAKNYRMNTQNTPDNGMNGCVETVQRTFDTAGLNRLKGTDSPWRQYAGNVDEVREAMHRGRGYEIGWNDAGPGDVVIVSGNHAGIVTDRKNEQGFPLISSNSGSHGSMSNTIPLYDRDGVFEVFRFGQAPKGYKFERTPSKKSY